MLTWETVKLAAYLDGYSYTITHGYLDSIAQGDIIRDEPDEWAVEITTPDGDMVSEVCSTIEEAKQFCENTAAEVPGGEVMG